MSAANHLPPAMAVPDFLAWEAPGGDRWELIDGLPRAMARGRTTRWRPVPAIA